MTAVIHRAQAGPLGAEKPCLLFQKATLAQPPLRFVRASSRQIFCWFYLLLCLAQVGMLASFFHARLARSRRLRSIPTTRLPLRAAAAAGNPLGNVTAAGKTAPGTPPGSTSSGSPLSGSVQAAGNGSSRNVSSRNASTGICQNALHWASRRRAPQPWAC
jgi:hypothetical protein